MRNLPGSPVSVLPFGYISKLFSFTRYWIIQIMSSLLLRSILNGGSDIWACRSKASVEAKIEVLDGEGKFGLGLGALNGLIGWCLSLDIWRLTFSELVAQDPLSLGHLFHSPWDKEWKEEESGVIVRTPLRVVIAFRSPFGVNNVLLGREPEPECLII
ncbi:hypothetical protein Tco_1014401 [Tanacetum coccineum]